MIPQSFFENCVFVCVDIQEGAREEPVTEAGVPALWRKMGFTAEDVNAARAFAWDVALPNACKVAAACKELGLPRIFIHWGYLFADGMDLDPDIRRVFADEHGADYSKWSGHVSQPGSQPASCLGIGPGDYVLPKAAQDAFASCNIDFMLRNLGARHLVFVGGHTEACLGKTARSAHDRGYETLCIEDATNNARESTRRNGIEQARFTYVLTTEEFLAQAAEALHTRTKA